MCGIGKSSWRKVAIINIYRTVPRNTAGNYRNVSPLSAASNLHADILKTD